MVEVKTVLKELTEGLTVSGFEFTKIPLLEKIAREYFDDFKVDGGGNCMLIKRAKSENAPKFLVDAHLDEVGMMVTEIVDGGFLRITEIGGIDGRILQASEVTVYGKEPIYGVITAVSPHLSEGDPLKLTPMKELFVDTGYSKEYLEKNVQIGDAVGFRGEFCELLNNNICGKGFDDKMCAAAAIEAADMLSETDFDGELTVMLSVKEEVSRAVVTGAYAIDPDYAVVLDVCNANVPGTELKKGIKVGGGCDISICAATAPKLAKKLIKCAKEHNIPHTVTVDGSSTGTNANDIVLVKEGIPTVLISVPLKNMHTYSEVGSVDDIHSAARLCKEFIYELWCEERGK